MKKTILYLSLLLSATSFAQWTAVHTSPGFTRSVQQVQFINEDTAYAVGDSLLLKSTNGGNTWTDLTANIPTIPSFYEMFFADGNTGYIGRSTFGTDSTIFKTTNGGNSWTNVSSTELSGGISQLFFTSPNVGYATGSIATGNAFARTTDGGQSWTKMQTPSAQLQAAMYFFNDSTGFGGRDTIMKTTNGGNSWTPASMPALSGGQTITNITFVNNMTGFAVTHTGSTVLKTTDGGATWTLHSTGVTASCYNMEFINADTGFIALNAQGLYFTADGGNTWKKDNSFPGTDVYCLSAAGKKLMVGTISGDIYLYDGWTTGIKSPETVNIKVFPNPSTTGVLHFSNPYQQPLNIKIYDATGRLLLAENNVNDKLNISLAPAVYYCHIQAEGADEVYMQKLVVQ